MYVGHIIFIQKPRRGRKMRQYIQVGKVKGQDFKSSCVAHACALALTQDFFLFLSHQIFFSFSLDYINLIAMSKCFRATMAL